MVGVTKWFYFILMLHEPSASKTAPTQSVVYSKLDDPIIDPPKDAWKLTYYIFFLVGFASLFPWHIFIKNSFFWERFSSTPYATTFSTWIARVYMATNLIAMISLIFLPNRYKGPSNLRVSMAFLGNVGVFLVMTFMPLCEWISGETYFYITLICAGFCGFFGGILQNSLFGLVSEFPSNYIQGVMAGQGLAGLVSSLILTIANIITGDGIKTSFEVAIDAVFYFGLSLFFIVIGFLIFLYVQRLPFYKHYSNPSLNRKEISSKSSDELLRPIQKGGISSIFTNLPSALYPLAVFFVLFITLSAFPFIFSNITSSSTSNSFFFRKLFIPMGYLLFDLGDYTGKSLPIISAFYTDNSILVLGSSFLRIAFIPLFMLCNFRDHPDFNGALRLFPSDYVFFTLAFLFGLTNGHSCSLLFMNSSKTVPDYLREKMGTIMALFLSIGLALGPFFAGVIGFFLKA